LSTSIKQQPPALAKQLLLLRLGAAAAAAAVTPGRLFNALELQQEEEEGMQLHVQLAHPLPQSNHIISLRSFPSCNVPLTAIKYSHQPSAISHHHHVLIAAL
jgi:hypothetical protein